MSTGNRPPIKIKENEEETKSTDKNNSIYWWKYFKIEWKTSHKVKSDEDRNK